MERDPIVTASWAGTAAYAAFAVVAAATGATPLEVLAVAVALGLFLAGCVTFLMAYARAVQRSRHERIDVAGVYLLLGDSMPAATKRHLLASLAVQVVVSVAAAFADYILAFGILVPTYGLGLAGLWAARHGTFPAKATAP